MNNEKQTKQGEQPQDWMLPEDIKIIETSDPKVMLGKWLAEPVTRSWTETFKDEVTGEIVEVDKNELIIARDIMCSQDTIQQIMFHIQAGEVKSVKVTETKPLKERRLPLSTRYIVSVDSQFGDMEYIYVAGVLTPEQAAKMVTDYCSVYPTPNIVGDFTVCDCTTTGILFLYDELVKAKRDIQKPRTRLLDNVQDETPRPPFTETPRYWNIGITKWTFSPWEGWENYKQTVCTEACDIQTAIKIAESWTDEIMETTDIDSWIADITKAGKSKITYVIPMQYVKLWQSKNHTKKEGGEA